MELAAACDIRIGSGRASFGMPEVRVGIPSVIYASLLPGLIGAGAARWLLLTGASIDARQALQWGVLQWVGAPDALDGLVEDTVAAIAPGGPLAVRAQKSLLRHWETDSPQEGMERSVTAFAEAFITGEPARQMAPFLQRKLH
jgi:enoyl-CoA hydratase